MVKRRITIQFKEQHQAEQFLLIKPKLLQILIDLSLYVSRKYHRAIVITDLKRTQAEQDAIYLNHPDPQVREAYRQNPWPSVHQFWRGADVLVDGLNIHQLNAAADYLTKKYIYDPARPKLKTAKAHDAGLGEHIHLQICEEN